MGNQMCTGTAANPCSGDKRSGADVVHLIEGEPIDNVIDSDSRNESPEVAESVKKASGKFSRGGSSSHYSSQHSRKEASQVSSQRSRREASRAISELSRKEAAQKFVPREEQKEDSEELFENPADLYQPIAGFAGSHRKDEAASAHSEEESDSEEEYGRREQPIPKALVHAEVFSGYDGPATQMLGETSHYAELQAEQSVGSYYEASNSGEEIQQTTYHTSRGDEFEPLYARKKKGEEKQPAAEKKEKKSKRKKKAVNAAVGIEGTAEKEIGGLMFDTYSHSDESEKAEAKKRSFFSEDLHHAAHKPADDADDLYDASVNNFVPSSVAKQKSEVFVDKEAYEVTQRFVDEPADPFMRAVDPSIFEGSFLETLFK